MQGTTLKPVILYFSSVLVEEQVLYNAASHEYSKIMSHTLRNLASNINHKIRYEKIYLAFAFFFFCLPLSSQAFRSYLQIFLTSTPTRNGHYLNGRNETASISPLLLHFEFQILFKELYLRNFYNPCTEMRTLRVYQIQFEHWMCLAITRGSEPPCRPGLVPQLWHSVFGGVHSDKATYLWANTSLSPKTTTMFSKATDAH